MALHSFLMTGITIVQPSGSEYEDLVHPQAEAALQELEKELRKYKELGDKRALRPVNHAALGIVQKENKKQPGVARSCSDRVGEGRQNNPSRIP